MNKTIAIQVTNIRYNSEEQLLEYKSACEKLNIDPIYFGLIPFSNEITGAERFSDYASVIPFGSIKIVKLWMQGLLPKSTKIFYDNIRFDQYYYAGFLPGRILNVGSNTFLGAIKDRVYPDGCFVKPTKDLKAFPGLLIPPGGTIAEELSKSQQSSDLTDEEIVLVAPIQIIQQEYRCFIVDGKFISGSTYKVASEVRWKPLTAAEEDELSDYFQIIKALYEPSKAYVIDFARMDNNELKVIEYNCINCAGMYCADRAKVFQALLDLV